MSTPTPEIPARRRGSTLLAASLAAAALAGVAAGVGGYTFVYAKGASYLTTDPRACANCHVMNEQYDAWTKSSHHAVAGCADCHMPHDFVGKWVAKAMNGYHHSLAFTTGRFPDPIRITEKNRRITEGTCRSCHREVVGSIDGAPAGGPHGDGALECVKCHRSVGHLH